MSYTLTVWPLPPGAAAPADTKAADALLERQRGTRAPVRDLPFPAFGAALYERFAPDDDDGVGLNAWGDGSEAGDTSGPTLTFALDTHGAHFDAAYRHAVACANRLGLNLHDPQSGEHFLADGRRLPDGRCFDALDALTAFRRSDWKATWAALRAAAAEGSAQALHDLGFLMREGVGLERLHMGTGRPHLRRLAAAVMQAAAAPDEPRQRQRLDTVKALPPFLREQVPALRDRLRAAPDAAARLAAVDAEIHAAAQRRKRLSNLPFDADALDEATWLALREEAWDGDAPSAVRLAYLLLPGVPRRAVPPAPLLQDGVRRYHALGAEAGDTDIGLALAGELLRGEDGWPLDVDDAIRTLRLLAGNGASPVTELAARLRERRDAGWDPAADRAQAEPLLHETGPRRLAALRRACELDHPEAWRRLGDAHLEGDLGLPKDRLMALTLHLVGNKELSISDTGIRHPPPARQGMDAFDVIDALRFVRQLIGRRDPWTHIARWRKTFDESSSIEVSVMPDGQRRAAVVPAPAERRAAGRRAAAPPARRRRWHRGHVLLVLGTAGPPALLALASGMGTRPARVTVLALMTMAAAGAWRVARDRDWGPVRRVAITVGAAVPLVGLFAAAALLVRP